tara:strand:- start:1256 stop:1687 length:432 start_codon:yes stop_codon:yes gene_type:complete
MSWVKLVFAVCGLNTSPNLHAQIDLAAKEFDIEKTLILSVIKKESQCSQTALGTSDDRGLMQVIPKWHHDRMDKLGVTDLFDPMQNLRVGAHFLMSLGVANKPYDALAFYNGGHRRPQSSLKYAEHVLEKKKLYDDMLNTGEE